MKFSLIYEAQTTDSSREGDRKVFDDTVEQVVLADKLGFDVVWAVEHTALSNYSHSSAPETLLAFLAGKTERIGIGHGVVCLPPAMNHPVKIAERISTLDLLSKGRVHFGMGKGGTQQEAGTFGYDLAQLQPQIDEMMYLIPKMFVQDEIEHDGEFVKIPRRPIHPKPYQYPHPPMYMACTNATSLATAGGVVLALWSLGLAVLMRSRKRMQPTARHLPTARLKIRWASARPSIWRPSARQSSCRTDRQPARSGYVGSATSSNLWLTGTREGRSLIRRSGMRM